MCRVDVAEQDVGVSDCRRLAAQVVADRAWKSAGALRADLQCAAGVDPDMRAAAGPDLGEIDRRNFQRISSPRQQARADHNPGADRVFLSAGDLAVFDHRRLRSRASHVECDDLLEVLRARQRLRADHAAGRTGFDDVHRPLGGSGVGSQAAVRLHEQQAGGNAGAVEAFSHLPQVRRHDRRDVGVDDGRRRALVFLDLG
jgi:hypothetical protein